jgi:hypothetical protein
VARFVLADFGIEVADRGCTEPKTRDANPRRLIRARHDIGCTPDQVNRHRGNPRFEPNAEVWGFMGGL